MSDPSRPKPFQPRGALDGNVVDTTMAKNMSFLLRWGNSCGIPFDAQKFCSENRVWSYLLPYLENRPQQPWTMFKIMDLLKHKTNRRIFKNKKKTKKRI